MRLNPAALFVALALASNAQGQQLLYSIDGTADGDELGESVAGIGDVNGDGFGDFIAGQPNGGAPGLPPGEVHCYSGIDGSVLYSVQGVADASFGHAVCRTPDLNGDGIGDFAVGAHTEPLAGGRLGSVSAFSGSNGALLWKTLSPVDVHFGFSVSAAGDVNTDGVHDVLVGSVGTAFNGSGTGTVTVLSGTDGTVVYELPFPPGHWTFGYSVTKLDDVNGDGLDDFAVGSPLTSGSVRIFSGLDGSALFGHSYHTLPGGWWFGTGLATGSDINGDGINDVAVAVGSASGSSPVPAAGVYSGADGATLLNLDLGEIQSARRTGEVAFIGDMNGDGVDDILMGHDSVARKLTPQVPFQVPAVEKFAGFIRVYSGADGVPILTIWGSEAFHGFGHSIANAGDVNGDGYDDILVGQVPEFPNYGVVVRAPGAVRVYAGGPLQTSFADVCNGDGGTQLGCTDCPCGNAAAAGTIGGCLNSFANSARLNATGDASSTLPMNSTSDLRFALTGGTPNSTCILRSSRTVPPGDLAHPCYGLDSGSRSVHFDGLRCVGPGRRLHGARRSDANGEVGATNDPWGGEAAPTHGVAITSSFITGQVRHFQVWYRDSPALGCGRGANTSQAVRIVFEP